MAGAQGSSWFRGVPDGWGSGEFLMAAAGDGHFSGTCLHIL